MQKILISLEGKERGRKDEAGMEGEMGRECPPRVFNQEVKRK